MKTRAIVTGHSRGLGTGIAAALLERGIPVLGVSRGTEAALAARFPALLQEAKLDLADAAALAAWLAGDALQRFLAGCQSALLVNNAGVVSPIGPLPSQATSAVHAAVTLNVAAPLMLSAAFTAASGGAADRRILHVSSGAGRTPYPGWAVYCATKAALDHHARCVALDATPGVRVCSLAPGIIDTDMQGEIRASDPERFPMHERFVKMAREGALADPTKTGARIVAYLLGERFGAAPVSDLREVEPPG
jgi:NAD(P)-dependent dehydrogenase (short-subunit alcohol dehydrogenase family)